MSQTLRIEHGTGRLFEEECLLGSAKNRSNTGPNDQGDIPGNLSDKDVPQKCAREKKTLEKYLKESCYYCIKCTAATFLAAFMWGRPLNNISLATTTHRKPRIVPDETSTQVRVQIVNKCKIKMVREGLYNMKDPP